MKNRLIFLLCLALLALTAFAACTPGGEQGGGNSGISGGDCEHPISAEWTTNATHHWREALCEHGEERGNYAEHSDTDDDGICDTCALEIIHKHTFSSEWMSNESHHWRTATCSHTDEIENYGLHSDEDGNGECDDCRTHVHVLDASGRCTVCGTQILEIDTSDIGKVISSIYTGQRNVSGGRITSSFIGGYYGSEYYTKSDKVVDYLFGNGSAYYKIQSNSDVRSTDKDGNPYEAKTSDLLERWISLESDNSVFGVNRTTLGDVVGDFVIDGAVSADALFGYYYSLSTLASGYGAEGVLSAIYEKARSENASDFVVNEGERSFDFSFNYTAANTTRLFGPTGNFLGTHTNVNYFVVSVEFNYNEDYTLTSLSINCDCYTNDSGQTGASSSTDANVDLIYDDSTGEVTLLDNALADTYSFSVEQQVSERSFVNEYTQSYFAPSSFDVYLDLEHEMPATDTISLSLNADDKFVRFFLKPTEEGKIFTENDSITFTTSNNAGLYFVGYDAVKVRGAFLAKTVGTYTVTVSYRDVTKTFIVEVKA